MIFALLLAAAVPPVAPPDPAALFQGDNRPVKFDPACRDFNLETLPGDPACAARVAKGETAATLAIVAHTLAELPARKAEVLPVLDRAIRAEDHPAAHYMLGLLLGTAETIRPDYAMAVRHLTIASDRGNAAAAALLADLLVAGKGAPRDMPRAIEQYERAMAGGFAAAADKLALLYLQGIYIPKNESLGVQILAAAAAAGDPRAAQLKAMADGSAKVRNMQLFPAADDAQVAIREFGVFDNPLIPPNFGFDEAFQATHYAPYGDPAVLARLAADPATQPTPYLYERARRLAAADPDVALRTYLLARMRMSYDARRCMDPAALEAVRAWDVVTVPDLEFLLRDENKAGIRAAAAAALKEEASMPADSRPWWVCRSGLAAMQSAMSGKPGPLALKPESEWPGYREAARQPVEALIAAAQ